MLYKHIHAPKLINDIAGSSNHKLPLPKQISRRIGSVHDSIKTDDCRIITTLVASSTALNSVSPYVNLALPPT